MASVTRAAPSTRPGDRRARIHAAACELFYARGFASVSIDDIARSVGISAPAVYRHYANKQELLEASVSFALAAVESALDESHDLDDTLARLARLGVDDRAFGVLIVREAVHLDGGRAEAARRVHDICVRLGERMALERPDLAPKPLGILARGLFAMVVATSFNPVCDGSAAYVEWARRSMVRYCASATLVTQQLLPHLPRRDERINRRPWLSRAQALLAEAPLLLTQRGSYESTTLDDIGAAVGMSRASVYKHFDSKAELFQAAAARSYSWSNADLERALAMSTSGEDVMRRALTSFVGLADAFATVAIEPEHADLTGPRSVVGPLAVRNAELWWDCIRAARPDLAPVAQNAVSYLVLGLVNALRRGSRGEELGPDVATIVEIALLVVLHI